MKVISSFTVFILTMSIMTSVLISIGCHNRLAPAGITPIVKNGISYEDAVLVPEQSSQAGIRYEHLWVKEKYPGYSWDKQVIEKLKGKYYDIVTLRRGYDVRLVYFDITPFYGKP